METLENPLLRRYGTKGLYAKPLKQFAKNKNEAGCNLLCRFLRCPGGIARKKLKKQPASGQQTFFCKRSDFQHEKSRLLDPKEHSFPDNLFVPSINGHK